MRLAAPCARVPRRRLGTLSGACLVVASMIGSGVFTTSGFALADLGTPGRVVLAWAVGGTIALCGALSYGALARHTPESGGEYLFLARALHPLAGFLAGWVSLLAGFTAPIAAAALGLSAYLAPSLGSELPAQWIGTAAIASAALLHGLRLRGGVLVQNAVVALKVAAITGFALWGAGRLPPGVSAPPAPPFEVGAFAVTLVWIAFSYSGWNAVVYVAGEMRDPERSLVRSILLGSGIVTALYLALNWVFVHAAPADALAGRAEIGALAAEALGGQSARIVVSATVALALFTSISANVMAGPRVYARMAQDGLFPQRIAAWSSDVPRAAVLLQAGLAVVVVWVGTLRELFGYIGFTLGLSAAVAVSTLFVLRRREGPERVPVPGYPLVPLAFVLATLASAAFMAAREPRQALLGLATAAAGVPVYAWLQRRERVKA
jgi:APA family basic amino acid/polyamine antiporter